MKFILFLIVFSAVLLFTGCQKQTEYLPKANSSMVHFRQLPGDAFYITHEENGFVSWHMRSKADGKVYRYLAKEVKNEKGKVVGYTFGAMNPTPVNADVARPRNTFPEQDARQDAE